jgi:hypothetical protein
LVNVPAADPLSINKGNAMRKDQQLGLDELMIVNPSSSGMETMFLGEDGTVYQVQGLGEENTQPGMGQYVLGEDGSLYQVQGFETGSSAEPAKKSGEGMEEKDGGALGRYFLGGDGVLYEVVR